MVISSYISPRAVRRRFADDTVGLAQAQLCELYQTGKSNVSEHIRHIFEEGELEEDSVVRKFRTTAFSCYSRASRHHRNTGKIIGS